jgi:hypothetical protein
MANEPREAPSGTGAGREENRPQALLLVVHGQQVAQLREIVNIDSVGHSISCGCAE